MTHWDNFSLGFPQESFLGLTLHNTTINNLGDRIEIMLIRFKDAKLGEVTDTLKDRTGENPEDSNKNDL